MLTPTGPVDPNLADALREAGDRVAAMTPVQRALMAARQAVSYVEGGLGVALPDDHEAKITVRALALLDRVGDAAADALIKGEAEVFWSKEEAEASEVLTALRNAPPGPDVIPEHERFVSRARVWAIKNRAAMDALLKGEAAVVPVEPTIEMVRASNPVDDAQDLLAHFTLHEGIAAGRLDQEV